MIRIELIYDDDCPNAGKAREILKEALGEAGLDLSWEEHERSDPAGPPYAKRYGSPTILVNGVDVAETPDLEGESCCRVYESEGKLSGVPSVEEVKRALTRVLSS